MNGLSYFIYNIIHIHGHKNLEVQDGGLLCYTSRPAMHQCLKKHKGKKKIEFQTSYFSNEVVAFN